MKLSERKAAKGGTWEVKPIYSLGELALMMGISRFKARGILKRNGVSLIRGGGGRGTPDMVTLVALRAAFPELWESMLMAKVLR